MFTYNTFEFWQSFLSANFLFSSIALANAILLLVITNLLKESNAKLILFSVITSVSALLFFADRVGSDFFILFPLTLFLLILMILIKVMKNYTYAGNFFIASNMILLFFGMLWGGWYLMTIPVSDITRALMLSSTPLIFLALPSGMIQLIEQFEVLCRKNWIRPRFTNALKDKDFFPKVCLHVPTYAEPPDMVIETLNKLSKLDYPNYEVILIDNNTKDSKLWEPVQEHCNKLGERFRFIHVEGIAGAKAGALNIALKKTAPDVEIIGVVDADYYVEPDFLSALIPFFKDSNMGFVQTPHDYREWENSRYLRMCYWEYQLFFRTTMVSLNERDAALTVGTMCLIRRKALEKAGGWAEWCVTEDSELSIRIHALGYTSVYTTESYGRGLIPETFSGYKKQRFRWSAGPVQELKHHLKLYLMWPWRKPSLLTLAQKIHHLNHGLDRFNVGIGLLFLPLGMAVVLSMLYHREVVNVPYELWLAATVILIASFILNWLLYKVTLGCSLKDMVGAMFASRSLTHIISIATLKAIFTRKIPWLRTDKFRSLPLGFSAILSTKAETIMGLSLITFALLSYNIMPKTGLLLMFLIGIVYRGLDYLTAPFLSLLSEAHLRKINN
jgi:cellulose synthase/poly-beta-1,6-N-acetylglucosamine synthase-like glycosyltransferase